MKREQWASRTGFILAAVGSAIGLGNIWRFPYMAYENGGGAFLIPYFFAMLTAGIPFLILEFGLGQKLRAAAPNAFAKIHSKMEYLGWFQVLIAAVIAVYYVAIIGWSISYLAFSFNQSWGADTNAFFFSEYLRLGDNTPSSLGSLQWHLVLPIITAWSVSFYATFTGVTSGIERVSKFMMPLLFVMILILTARVLTLPGAGEGLNWLFKPDFSALLNLKVWSAAYSQIFFTLSVGFAIMVAYSSYLPAKSDINNNAMMTVFINCGFSLLAGVMIFAALGYMAKEQGVALTEVVSSGVGLAFVTLPAVVNLLPAPWFFGPLLFLTLIVAGVSSHISIMEAITSSARDKFGWSRRKAATILCGGGAIISLSYATNGGLLLLDIVDYYINNVALLSSCLVELFLLAWTFKKLPEYRAHINSISDFAVNIWWKRSIKYICVGLLALITGNNLITAITENYGGYASADQLTFGWGLLTAMLLTSLLLARKNTFALPQEA